MKTQLKLFSLFEIKKNVAQIHLSLRNTYRASQPKTLLFCFERGNISDVISLLLKLYPHLEKTEVKSVCPQNTTSLSALNADLVL